MGLDIWYQADIARLLAAQEEATAEMEKLGINADYIAGRRSHARAMAAAFGLPDPTPATRRPGPVVYELRGEAWHVE